MSRRGVSRPCHRRPTARTARRCAAPPRSGHDRGRQPPLCHAVRRPGHPGAVHGRGRTGRDDPGRSRAGPGSGAAWGHPPKRRSGHRRGQPWPADRSGIPGPGHRPQRRPRPRPDPGDAAADGRRSRGRASALGRHQPGHHGQRAGPAPAPHAGPVGRPPGCRSDPTGRAGGSARHPAHGRADLWPDGDTHQLWRGRGQLGMAAAGSRTGSGTGS